MAASCAIRRSRRVIFPVPSGIPAWGGHQVSFTSPTSLSPQLAIRKHDSFKRPQPCQGSDEGGSAQSVVCPVGPRVDDQRFGIFATTKRLAKGADDRSIAFAALREGDAKLIEQVYAKKFDAKANASGGSDAQQAVKELPFAVIIQASFVYAEGAEFVASLVKRAKGFKLVNEAFGKRPPVSTAQVLHTEQYLRNKRPEPVALAPGAVLGDGWNSFKSETFGELEVLALLAFDKAQLQQYKGAAAGWAGGQIELWRRGKFDPKACSAPCRERDAAVLGLRWNDTKDAGEFERALRSSLEKNQEAKLAGKGSFRVAGAGVAMSSSAKRTTVAYAPTPELAAKLAERAAK